MTIKSPRTRFDKEKDEERIRFLRREQQEQEARKSLRDFLRHQREEEEYEDRNAPPNSIS